MWSKPQLLSEAGKPCLPRPRPATQPSISGRVVCPPIRHSMVTQGIDKPKQAPKVGLTLNQMKIIFLMDHFTKTKGSKAAFYWQLDNNS